MILNTEDDDDTEREERWHPPTIGGGGSDSGEMISTQSLQIIPFPPLADNLFSSKVRVSSRLMFQLLATIKRIAATLPPNNNSTLFSNKYHSSTIPVHLGLRGKEVE